MSLLTCPFCGVTPELQPCLRHGFFITCENHHCLVEPQTLHDHETVEQAVEAWNTRLGPALEPAVLALEEQPQQPYLLLRTASRVDANQLAIAKRLRATGPSQKADC